MMKLIALWLLAAAALAQPAKDRMVLLVSLDGFAAYALENPKLAAPTLRRLAREGASARMQVINPSVTWPNHTSMVTGVDARGHSVLYNGRAERGAPGQPIKVEPWLDKTELVKATTVYDLAHAAGLTTAEVDWVAILNAKTITWSFAEIPDPARPVEREMMAGGLVTEEELREFRKAPITWRDEIWTQAGLHLIRKHRPNLLLFHLLTTDSAQHRYGARSLGGDTALALADRQLARLVEAVDPKRATVIVVSDHGFKTAKRIIQPNVVLGSEGWTISEGGTAMVYVHDRARVAEMRAKLAALEGVHEVLGPDQFARYGYPQPSENPRMADLVLAAAEGYGFGGATAGPAIVEPPGGAGQHGYLHSDPEMDAILVAWGWGIRPGARLGRIRNLDVAPTVARLLGLEMRGVEGRVLTEALR